MIVSLAFWQQIIDARMEYWYRKIAGYPQVWDAAKKEAMEGLHKVRFACCLLLVVVWGCQFCCR